MSTDSNKCRGLEIKPLYKVSGNPLEDLYHLQKNIQEKVYGYNFEDIRKDGESMLGFFNMNYHAIQDELREFVEALGGMDSHGTALWKPWKQKHKEALQKPFSELTQQEKLELKFEWVDLLHFMFNLAIMIDLTPEEMYDLYQAKNAENRERQLRGY